MKSITKKEIIKRLSKRYEKGRAWVMSGNLSEQGFKEYMEWGINQI